MDGIRKRPIFPDSLPAGLQRSQQLQNDFAVISTAFCRHKGAVDKIPVWLKPLNFKIQKTDLELLPTLSFQGTEFNGILIDRPLAQVQNVKRDLAP